MEIFFQTLYESTEERTSMESQQIILKDSKIGSKEIYNGLETRSQRPESFSQKTYRFCFLLPIGLMILCYVMWPDYYVIEFSSTLPVITIYCYLILKYPVTNDWLYIFRLQLNLWFRKLPEPKTKLVDPRCIFVHWKSSNVYFKHVSIKVLEKVRNKLSIHNLKDLESPIKIVQSNPTKFRILYLIRDAVLTVRCTKIQLLLVTASLFFILNYYFGNNIAIWNSLKLVLLYTLPHFLLQYHTENSFWYNYSVLLVILSHFFIMHIPSVQIVLVNPLFGVICCWNAWSLLKTDYYDYGTDPDHNFQMLDVICRLHREIKNKSIYITIVTDDLVCSEKIPERFRKYFNFIIIPRSNSELTENHGQIFDLGLISNIRPPRPIPSSTNMELIGWVDASLRCINVNTTQFVSEGLKFLSLLIATNNGSLTEIEMLSVVKMQLKAFAGNYANEISFKNQEDFQKVKEFFGYLQSLEIIPKIIPITLSTNKNLREWVDASLRCINDNTTQFVGEGLKFLSSQIETNNGSLTDIEMLNMVKMQLIAFAENYTNEISFKNQEDVQKVKDFFGYLQSLEIIPKTSTEP